MQSWPYPLRAYTYIVMRNPAMRFYVLSSLATPSAVAAAAARQDFSAAANYSRVTRCVFTSVTLF